MRDWVCGCSKSIIPRRKHGSAIVSGQANLAIPATLTFTPVDFTCQDLARELAGAGFQSGQPAFFIWLGVVPYLKHEAISSILQFIAGSPGGEVVFDYSEPLENYSAGTAGQRRGDRGADGRDG